MGTCSIDCGGCPAGKFCNSDHFCADDTGGSDCSSDSSLCPGGTGLTCCCTTASCVCRHATGSSCSSSADCCSPDSCLTGICQTSGQSCPQAIPRCGDGCCDSQVGENNSNCPQDCEGAGCTSEGCNGRCGSATDKCGNTLACGNCSSGSYCGSDSRCHSNGCTPTTSCSSSECLQKYDGCGHLLNCTGGCGGTGPQCDDKTCCPKNSPPPLL